MRPRAVLRWLGLISLLLGLELAVSACNKAPAPPKVTPGAFDDVRRAGQALKSATDVGVTVIKYRELVQNFSTEAAIAQEKVKTVTDRALVADYRSALQAYRDALAVLDAKNEETRRQGGEPVRGYIPVKPELRHIADIYILQIVPGLSNAEYRAKSRDITERVMTAVRQGRAYESAGPPVSHDELFNSDAAIKVIWSAASDRLDRANQLLRQD